MSEVEVVTVEKQEKGRVRIGFENGRYITLYRGEIRKLPQQDQKELLTEGAGISEELYQKLIYEIVGVRAKRRAVHLLEQMDRTKKQMTDKLKQNGYPRECIETAISYLEEHHFLDDMRYARNYIRFRQDKKSRQRLKTDLMLKGIDKDMIETAFEEEYEADETVQIRKLLEKRHFQYGSSDRKEIQRTCQFLMRKGFRGSDILRVMQAEDIYYEY